MKKLKLLLSLLFLTSSAGAVPAAGTQIMIAGPSPYAVEVGKNIARKGGNVVDVAVAAALSLAVTHPYYGSLGGGGFALVKMKSQPVQALDFRETAPKAMGPQFFVDKKAGASVDGPHAAGVPGLPAGLWELHKRYGKLTWNQLFTKSIELASKGFPVSGDWSHITGKNQTRFNSSGQRIFLKPGGAIYRPGEVMKQPQLATLLREMSNRGIVPFYREAAARDMVETLRNAGGVITLEDFKNYKVRWLAPLATEFRAHKIYLMPPPSSGGLLIQAGLALAEKLNLSAQKFLSVTELHLLGEIFKQIFRTRQYLGDPDFTKNPMTSLVADKHIAEMAKLIHTQKALDVSTHKAWPSLEANETTHLSVLDANGQAVAITVTLNGLYGSGVVSSRYGIALNNEIDDFTTRPGEQNMFGLVQGEANQIQAGKRPLSSMSPTLVEKDNQIIMSVGSPGGPRIITAVYQVLYRTLVNGLDIDQAIQAPRVHHQFLPNILYVDTLRFSPEILDSLKSKGHHVEEGTNAKVYAVRKTAAGILEGAYDLRGEGAAGGY